MKKVIHALHKGTPHKSRLLLVVLWAVFVALVINNVLLFMELGLV